MDLLVGTTAAIHRPPEQRASLCGCDRPSVSPLGNGSFFFRLVFGWIFCNCVNRVLFSFFFVRKIIGSNIIYCLCDEFRHPIDDEEEKDQVWLRLQNRDIHYSPLGGPVINGTC
ncbi:hypothetical protein BDV38DRAFT_107814 [Aspergillus pseudotamarii]|uniref:Uncharacterized protein n=1 Tax=Aspergillus pseudotamarii TaxID=132259 RepID=A0A5N6SPU2_ASPPS|nr:uncharacterized protein BDV38DRAFT_107814 [Aspergillus pseudotamarii]KAE8136722.1 hypothetical protein BDV38DRAFT_107814 [Aspergillus pseudotamarii]